MVDSGKKIYNGPFNLFIDYLVDSLPFSEKTYRFKFRNNYCHESIVWNWKHIICKLLMIFEGNFPATASSIVLTSRALNQKSSLFMNDLVEFMFVYHFRIHEKWVGKYRKTSFVNSKFPKFCTYLRNLSIPVAFYGKWAIICRCELKSESWRSKIVQLAS